MSRKSFSTELERALARPDANVLTRQVETYFAHHQAGLPEWTDETSDDLNAIMDASFDDPEKTLAYIMIAAANYDDEEFLGFMAAGLLEDLLQHPSPEILQRLVDEARKTKQLRWMLAIPFRHAIPEPVWDRIGHLVMTDVDNVPVPPRPSV